jgi:4-amino-4-deoxy-L-arabinose transferase-like glycosyltransferase
MTNGKLPRRVVIIGVLTLLLLHATLAIRSALHRSVTVDELFHVTGGYVYDKFNDFRIHPENGVLPQRLQALPAILMHARPPPTTADNIYWLTSDINVVGYQFFYESGNDHWPLLMGARAVNVLMSLFVCMVVFIWARRLGGDLASLLSLMLAALSPVMLANGPLATTDMAAALALLGSVSLFWWQLNMRGWRPLLVSAIVFGLACVAKFSAVLLVPILLLLAAIHWVIRSPADRRGRWLLWSMATHAVVAWLIIWACYDFRFSAAGNGVAPPDQFIRSWDWALDHIRWQAPIVDWMRHHHVLPDAFLFGYAHAYYGSLQRAAFLAGDYSNLGWPMFFPLTFLWKSTFAEIGGLVLGVLVAALRWQRLRPWLVRLAPLLVLTAVYGGMAVAGHLNIGQRHLLPLYPVLFIAIGLAVSRVRYAGAIATLLAGLQVFAASQSFPFYMAYFNAFAGGPDNGWRLLVDSSLDWGQDLPALKSWLERNNSGREAEPVFLSYFGNGEPRYYNIHASRMLFNNGFELPPLWWEPHAGIYCVSATILQQVYNPVHDPWTTQFEKEYQELRRFEPLFHEYLTNETTRRHLVELVPDGQWRRAWQRFELLRSARLCTYLRARGPDANAGHSILIFHLSATEVDQALRSSYSTWINAMETASRRRPR